MKKEKNIGISGMHCAGCSSRVEKALNQLPGVSLAHVNLTLEEASIVFDDKKLDLKQVEETIQKLGFEIREDIIITEDEHILAMKVARKRMWITWLITIVVTVFMLPHMIWGKMIVGHHFDSWLMFSLSVLAMIFPARGVYVSAFKSVKSGSANMDVLIAMGTLASLLTMPLSMFMKGIPGHAFAGIAAMILAFHLTGRYLEFRARGKASEAIRKLMNLGVKTAIIIENGQEIEVPIHKIKLGDEFIVKPGMKVPTDGSIVDGITSIDESMATGESMPVLRKKGDSVLGATLNVDGLIRVKATRIGGDTFLAQVIRLVQEAQHSKVPIQVLADKITAIFVPIILVLALATFALWMIFPGAMQAVAGFFTQFINLTIKTEGLASALMASIAVLVIACPCALGLATPTALMVGSGIGANRGILIRNGEALQRMKDIRAIVFDKTGTLTHGKPDLIQIIAMGADEQKVLKLAASIEAGSEHPLGAAIVRAARERKLDLLEVSETKADTGKGIKAQVQSSLHYIGNLAYIQENGLEITAAQKQLVQEASPYATAVYLFDEEQVLGALLIADKIKEEAKDVIAQLKQLSITPVMISGDNSRTAKAIADQCGIEIVLAEVLPKDKADEVIKLKAKYGAVAMVGDGINDAPALKAADIGIAMGQGTDIAIEAADITIVRNNLQSLITAINLSNQTFKKIKQNLFWAFFYNLIAIPLAIFGVLHPVVAESAMAISSVSVVTNANLLKRKKI